MDKFRADFNEEFDIFKEVEPPKDMKENIIKAIKREKMKELISKVSAIAAVIVLVIIPILTIYNSGFMSDSGKSNFANSNKSNKRVDNIAGNIKTGSRINKVETRSVRNSNIKDDKSAKINKKEKADNYGKSIIEKKIAFKANETSDNITGEKSTTKMSEVNNSTKLNDSTVLSKSEQKDSMVKNEKSVDISGAVARGTSSQLTSNQLKPVSKNTVSETNATGETNKAMQITGADTTDKLAKTNKTDVSSKLTKSEIATIADNSEKPTVSAIQTQPTNGTDNLKHDTILSTTKLAATAPQNTKTVTINYSDAVDTSTIVQNITDIIKEAKITDYSFDNNTFSLTITQTQYAYILEAIKKQYSQGVVVQDTTSISQNIILKIVLRHIQKNN